MISPTIGSDHSRRIPCQSVRELHFLFLFIFVCFQQVFVHITYLCSRCEMSVTFGQLSLASSGIAKSSTSFGWGLRRKCHLCRVAGNTVWSRIAREFQLRCGNVTLRTAIQDTLLYFTSGSVTLSETHYFDGLRRPDTHFDARKLATASTSQRSTVIWSPTIGLVWPKAELYLALLFLPRDAMHPRY